MTEIDNPIAVWCYGKIQAIQNTTPPSLYRD